MAKAPLRRSGDIPETGSITVDVQVRTGVNPEGVRSAPDGSLQVRVSARPEKGKANKRVVELLATEFGVPKSGVTILRGQTSSR